MKARHAASTLAVLAALPLAAAAHDLQHGLIEARALVLEMRYGDGSPFAFEAYEVYRGDDEVPHQVGRTDKAGRIAWLPNGPATWRVKAFSEDGHGLDIRVEGGPGGTVTATDQSALDRLTRILAGVGIILGVFGALALFYRRRTP